MCHLYKCMGKGLYSPTGLRSLRLCSSFLSTFNSSFLPQSGFVPGICCCSACPVSGHGKYPDSLPRPSVSPHLPPQKEPDPPEIHHQPPGSELLRWESAGDELLCCDLKWSEVIADISRFGVHLKLRLWIQFNFKGRSFQFWKLHAVIMWWEYWPESAEDLWPVSFWPVSFWPKLRC